MRKMDETNYKECVHQSFWNCSTKSVDLVKDIISFVSVRITGKTQNIYSEIQLRYYYINIDYV